MLVIHFKHKKYELCKVSADAVLSVEAGIGPPVEPFEAETLDDPPDTLFNPKYASLLPSYQSIGSGFRRIQNYLQDPDLY